MFYISFVKPSGAKKTLAITSLFLGFITLHMTMSRSEIALFWSICLYLLLFIRSKSMHRMIIISFLLTALAGLSLVLYFGTDVFKFAILRLSATAGEFTVEEGRFSQVYNLWLYLLDHVIDWWGHGIASWRLYKDEFYEAGIIHFVSGGLYSSFSALFWEAGIAGMVCWLIWFKKHFNVLKTIRNKKPDVKWMAHGLKVILVGFLLALFTPSPGVFNFRIIGYFSLLTGLILKNTYHHKLSTRDLPYEPQKDI